MTFSTSMMASSTNSPMAIARPPRLMLLMVKPNQFMVTTAATSESGIASKVMVAARKFIRNSATTITTRMAPSRNALVRLSSDRSMKSAWRNTCLSIFMPAGRLA